MAGDTIYVVLPGFSRPEYLLYEAILPGGDNAASFGAITWDQASETLTLTVSETLRESREYQVDVPLEAGLRLPYKGIPRENSGIMAYISAVNGGPSEPTPLKNVVPVGSFTDSTALEYKPATAGYPVMITLRFVPVMKISAGERVMIDVPNFFCSKDHAEGSCQSGSFSSLLTVKFNGTRPVTLTMPSLWRFVPFQELNVLTLRSKCMLRNQCACADLKCCLSSGATRRISFTMPQMFVPGVGLLSIEPGAFAEVIIEQSVGIAIGEDGLERNDERLKLSCDAQSGPVLPATIYQSPNIGFFSERNVNIFSRDGLIPNMPLSLALRFTSIKEIRTGERVILALPGFTRTGSGPIPHNNPHFDDAVWDPINRHLEFVVRHVVRANFRQDLLLEQNQCEIRLPASGIARDSLNLTLSTDAEAGPVEMLPIRSNPPAGSLQDVALSYDPPMASAIASIFLQFRTTMQLEEYDVIEVHLPSFVGPTFELITSAQIQDLNAHDADMPFHGVWSNSKPDKLLVLMVSCNKSLPANTTFHLVISSSAGIRMPAQAIIQNQQDFKISSNAKAGPVVAQRIMSVRSVGAFVNSLGEGVTMDYSSCVDDKDVPMHGPGAFCTVSLSLSVDMPILAGVLHSLLAIHDGARSMRLCRIGVKEDCGRATGCYRLL